MKTIGLRPNNRIWIAAGVVVFLLFSLLSVRSNMVSAVALEQSARCSMAEHTHGSDCYTGSRLTCLQTQHTHTENCYLVLLRDNDINNLLAQVDADTSNSLEVVISDTVETAAQLSETVAPPSQQNDRTHDVQAVALSNTSAQNEPSEPAEAPNQLDVSALNEAITENNVEPGLVLNENLYKASTLAAGPSDLALPTDTSTLLAAGSDGGISTLAVGDSASTGNNNANFYVYLDNKWTCFGKLTFTTSGSSRRYTARLTTGNVVNLINNSLGTDYSWSDLNLRWGTSANPSSWNGFSINNSNITFLNGSSTYFTSNNTARSAKYVFLMDNSGDPLPFYTVNFEYPDGSSSSQYVPGGSSVTLSGDYMWSDGSAQYTGGQSVTINGPKTFTASEDNGTLRIVYNIGFPTVSGVTVATRPTIYGTTATTLTDTVVENGSALIRNVSQHEVPGELSDGNTRIIRFSGWRVGTSDTILSPNSTLNWDELQSFASGSRLNLTAVWETSPLQTVSFFVRYDSKPIDTQGGGVVGGAVTDYTPELFATHVGGTDAASLSVNELNNKYYIADTTTDNSFGADQRIRALYGEQPGIWLQSFPDDEEIFQKLITHAQNRQLEVDGEPVAPEDLHAEAYAIRWYVFKAQSDAWHIDGRLVKKQGIVYVKKSFAGNVDGVALAKQDFSITAANGAGTKQHTLTLNNAAGYDPAADTYTWEVNGLDYGEPWTLTEHTYNEVNNPGGINYHGYSEYIVVDAFNQQNKNGPGTTVDIVGQTYALDAGTDQIMRVEFTNVYHTSDSIIIKKEDARTGNPLAGATFQLLQNESPLTFTYDSTKNQYIYDPSGSITELSGTTTGYYELVISGFSYDAGNVVVQELQPPSGYTPIENITIGYLPDPDTGQLTDQIGILSTSPLATYHDGLLIVENTTENTSVTVSKQWLCPEADWADVTVQLLANGQLVSSLIPGVEPSVQLTAANGYRATWSGLPAYANGTSIVWSVRETKIGTENCKPDYSFANWIVSYSEPTYTKDGSGKVTNTAFVIQNDTRRTLLRLTKTNLSGTLRLPGATFSLQHLVPDGSGGYTANSAFVTRTGVTESDGTLTFDNLLYGYYRLQETSPPDGYEILPDPIYLTLREDGTVVVEAHAYAQAGSSAYTVHVTNASKRPLPDTGGSGPGIYQALGILLMLSAAWIWSLPHNKKEGRWRSE
ncbi:MAG: Cna B-type domain-containing protein [Oscillospiraceae bacterium]|nr:Cna B-type domain-containing protein [Oscillospiraceae bacterium]